MFQTEFVTYAHGYLVQSLVQPVCYLTAYLTHTHYKLPCCLAWRCSEASVKEWKTEADDSPRTRVEFKNTWIYTPLPLHAFLACMRTIRTAIRTDKLDYTLMNNSELQVICHRSVCTAAFECRVEVPNFVTCGSNNVTGSVETADSRFQADCQESALQQTHSRVSLV
jgi:hypothetical protein